ncbi:helix-turn-helix domain-containing protein [Pseudochryseolinea flava]|uniref:DNA-binding protein n=1 Tax=Pseudochryseolinea flava TaxID=2059302 RepID=A0A364Y074_9BACT|nr:helix-turn-helix domain-containing protein [Pseudochryseolinea flava]RAV99660.1 DNA-binding protein [Pseudochryseolinea flava]
MLPKNINEQERRVSRDQLITIGDLESFRISLLEDLKSLMTPTTSHANKQWLRSAEVRKMLGISHGTLQTLRINRTLPFTKIGGIVYYRYEDIDNLLNNQTSK